MTQAQGARRIFLARHGRAAGLGLVAAGSGALAQLVAPRIARATGVTLRTLSKSQAVTLEALGEALLPGARDAGIAHFVDHQLSADAADSLLMLRYLDWPAPYAPFYASGLSALDALALARHQQSFDQLDGSAAARLIGEMSRPGPSPAGWQGVPASLFYFAVRADAVDVVYGTQEGFERLGVPYMAHIVPPGKW